MVVNNYCATMMQVIVHNANSWCKYKFTGSQIYIDMAWSMISYLELLKSKAGYRKKTTQRKKDFNASAVKRNWKPINALKLHDKWQNRKPTE